MFRRLPRVGDEVRTTKPVRTSLLGSPVGPGARAVVLAVSWTTATIKLDTGNTFVTTTVASSALRVVRRGVGEAKFTERGDIVHLARLGVALSMLAPLLIFTVRYVIATGTTDGLLSAITAGLVQSVFDIIRLAIAQPFGTAIYLLIGWALWRFAFPK